MNYLSREFYEQTYRSAVLRNLSIEALQASRGLAAGQQPSDEAIGVLMNIDASLTTLGITPGMHAIPKDAPDRQRRKAEMAADPVIASEWIAGQLRDKLIGSLSFSDGGATALAEHDMLDNPANTLHFVEINRLGPKQQAFLRNWELLGALSGLLDEQAGVSQLS